MPMLEYLKELHSSQGIAQIVQSGGLFALCAIIFAETGLLVGFFLPGDSLLITAGILANPENPNFALPVNMLWLNFLLVVMAIVGDQVGYYLGLKAGDSIWERKDGRFYKRKHLEAAHAFYLKHGAFSIVGARYVPILRTFVPFTAGVARMEYRKFVFWNILGGVLWITSLLWVGYYLGQTSLANRLDKIIVTVIFVSILPMIVTALKRMFFTTKDARPAV